MRPPEETANPRRRWRAGAALAGVLSALLPLAAQVPARALEQVVLQIPLVETGGGEDADCRELLRGVKAGAGAGPAGKDRQAPAQRR